MGQRIIDIYSYTDHQLYLNDWICHRKETGKPVSLAWFSNKLGLKSRSYFQRVLKDPQKPMSAELRNGLMELLQLSTTEREYFEALVGFNQAQTLEEKNPYYARMHRLLLYRQSGAMDAARYEYLSTWWLPVLREVAIMKNWKGDFEAMGKTLEPSISAAQVKHGLEILLRLGFLREVHHQYQQVDSILNTGHDVASLAIANYHTSILELAQKAVSSQQIQEREFGAMTLGVPAHAYEQLKDKIRNFQRELAQEAMSIQGNPQVVYQFGIQLYRVTTSRNS